MSRKDAFLTNLDREFATTLRVLNAFPEDKLDLKPSEHSNTAGQLFWTFTLERRLGLMVWNDAFAHGMPEGAKTPTPPSTKDELLSALETAHRHYREVIASASEQDLDVHVRFFTAPKTIGPISRHEWIWFLLHDEIHHRGQFSVYLRIAGAKVPSIYGPTRDEPWT